MFGVPFSVDEDCPSPPWAETWKRPSGDLYGCAPDLVGVLGAASEELIALAVRTAGGAVAGTDDDEAIRLFSLLNGFVLALLGDPFLVGVQGADWPASSLSAAEMEAQ